MATKKYYPSQVIYETPEAREKAQEFCREHFGRSFSEQCRHFIHKAMREAKAGALKDSD